MKTGPAVWRRLTYLHTPCYCAFRLQKECAGVWRRLKGGQSHRSRVGRRKHVVWHRGKLHFCEFCHEIRARLRSELNDKGTCPTIQMATRREDETVQTPRPAQRPELPLKRCSTQKTRVFLGSNSSEHTSQLTCTQYTQALKQRDGCSCPGNWRVSHLPLHFRYKAFAN